MGDWGGRGYKTTAIVRNFLVIDCLLNRFDSMDECLEDVSGNVTTRHVGIDLCTGDESLFSKEHSRHER